MTTHATQLWRAHELQNTRTGICKKSEKARKPFFPRDSGVSVGPWTWCQTSSLHTVRARCVFVWGYQARSTIKGSEHTSVLVFRNLARERERFPEGWHYRFIKNNCGASAVAWWWRIHVPRQETQFSPWASEDPCNRKWHPTPVFLPRESRGQRSLVGYVHGVTKSQTRLSTHARMLSGLGLWPHPRGLRLHFRAGFSSCFDVGTLVRGWVRSEGLGAALLSWFCSLLCVHVEACTGHGWLLPGQIPFCLSGRGGAVGNALCLRVEQHRRKRTRSRSPVLG